MKKIIIARTIMHALGGHDTLFKRGNIMLFPARTSEEILNLHGVHKADMIVTEASLPLMGGAKLCQAIRANEELRGVSLIMACEGAEESACRAAGVNAIVKHPVDIGELFSRIAELLVVPERQEIRTLLHVSVNGRDGSKSFLGTTLDISISGLSLETEHALKKGDRVTCLVAIGKRELGFEGVIMRVEAPPAGKFRYGVKFLSLDTKSMIIIDQFVKGSLKQ
jgi:CheY-like chemotaxis protein